jgi:hypothetical protein
MTFVNHMQFDINNLIFGAIETKTSKAKMNEQGQMESVSYKTQDFSYKYTNPDGTPNIGPLNIEGPVCFSPQGITEKISQSGYPVATLFTQFDSANDPNVTSFTSMGEAHSGVPMGPMSQIHKKCLDEIWRNKAQIPSVKAQQEKGHVLGIFKPPIYFARDAETSQIVPGSKGSKFFKLTSYGEKGTATRNETLFKVPITTSVIAGKNQYQTVPWDYLNNVGVKFVPIIHVKGLMFNGSSITLQMIITGAVITDIQPSGSQSVQGSTLDMYAGQDVITDTISAQLKILQERLKTVGAPESPKQEEKKTEDVSSLIAICDVDPLPVVAEDGVSADDAIRNFKESQAQAVQPTQFVQPVQPTQFAQPTFKPPSLASMLGSGPSIPQPQ